MIELAIEYHQSFSSFVFANSILKSSVEYLIQVCMNVFAICSIIFLGIIGNILA